MKLTLNKNYFFTGLGGPRRSMCAVDGCRRPSIIGGEGLCYNHFDEKYEVTLGGRVRLRRIEIKDPEVRPKSTHKVKTSSPKNVTPKKHAREKSMKPRQQQLTTYSEPKRLSRELSGQFGWSCHGESYYVYSLSYVDHSTLADMCKIGVSSNVSQRIKTLQDACGMRVRLNSLFYCCCKHHSRLIESTLHKSFSGRRLLGEWFRLSPEEQSNLTSLFHRIEEIQYTEDVGGRLLSVLARCEESMKVCCV